MRRVRRGTGMMAAIVLLMTAAGEATAQARDLLHPDPEGWTLRRDRPTGGDDPRLRWVDGGLDIRTGAAAILYRNDARTDEDSFAVELDVAQFDPQRRNEAYGIVLGGRELDGAGQSYVYVLIRQDGMILVKRRTGEQTSLIRDWTPAPTLATWDGRAAGADRIRNRLRVRVDGSTLTLELNDTPAGTLTLGRTPRGIVGLRVNHGLHVRVSDFRLYEGATDDRIDPVRESPWPQ